MTGPGAGATRRTRPSEPALRTPSAGVEATLRRVRGPSGEREKKMTFQTGVVKMGYSEEEISAVLGESEQARKHRQKLAKVTQTVAAYRLIELQYFQAREKLATWRGTHGYDRDDSWMHGTLPFRLKNSLRVCGPICKS